MSSREAMAGPAAVVSWLTLLVFLSSAARAASLIEPGDAQLRSDVELLADAGYLHAPLTSWPLPWHLIAADLEQADVRSMSPVERAAWNRLAAMLHLEQSVHPPEFSIGASARAGDPPALRWYESEPRADESLRLGATSGIGDTFSYNLKLQLVHNPDDGRETIRPDGSYASFRAGNWLINAGWINRWWGPGWSGSMSLGTNARPTPGVAVSRASAKPFDLPVLDWLGPWRLTLFADRLESDRYIPHPWFFGARFAFKPIHNVTIGLSRTSQWGGEGQPEDWVHFRDMVLGHSYHSSSTYQGTGVPGSSQAGLDIRWHFDIGEQPFALYAYQGGTDGSEETRVPRKFTTMLGFETTGAMPSGGAWRLFVEYADTTIGLMGLSNNDNFYNYAYENGEYKTGYRYLGQPLVYPTDNDSRLATIGAILSASTQQTFSLLLQGGVINADDSNREPPGGNVVAVHRTAILNATVSWIVTLPDDMGQVTISAGATRWTPLDAVTYYDQRLSVSWQYDF